MKSKKAITPKIITAKIYRKQWSTSFINKSFIAANAVQLWKCMPTSKHRLTIQEIMDTRFFFSRIVHIIELKCWVTDMITPRTSLLLSSGGFHNPLGNLFEQLFLHWKIFLHKRQCKLCVRLKKKQKSMSKEEPIWNRNIVVYIVHILYI